MFGKALLLLCSLGITFQEGFGTIPLFLYMSDTCFYISLSVLLTISGQGETIKARLWKPWPLMLNFPVKEGFDLDLNNTYVVCQVHFDVGIVE